jgi:hypothetical protein
MTAYVVFTRIRTRDPAELAQYTAQAQAFVAGHTVERLANFGACAVLEGLGGQSLRYQPRDNAFHQSQAPRNAIVGFAM